MRVAEPAIGRRSKRAIWFAEFQLSTNFHGLAEQFFGRYTQITHPSILVRKHRHDRSEIF